MVCSFLCMPFQIKSMFRSPQQQKVLYRQMVSIVSRSFSQEIHNGKFVTKDERIVKKEFEEKFIKDVGENVMTMDDSVLDRKQRDLHRSILLQKSERKNH